MSIAIVFDFAEARKTRDVFLDERVRPVMFGAHLTGPPQIEDLLVEATLRPSVLATAAGAHARTAAVDPMDGVIAVTGVVRDRAERLGVTSPVARAAADLVRARPEEAGKLPQRARIGTSWRCELGLLPRPVVDPNVDRCDSAMAAPGDPAEHMHALVQAAAFNR